MSFTRTLTRSIEFADFPSIFPAFADCAAVRPGWDRLPTPGCGQETSGELRAVGPTLGRSGESEPRNGARVELAAEFIGHFASVTMPAQPAVAYHRQLSDQSFPDQISCVAKCHLRFDTHHVRRHCPVTFGRQNVSARPISIRRTLRCGCRPRRSRMWSA